MNIKNGRIVSLTHFHHFFTFSGFGAIELNSREYESGRK
jgi:hypothetical protein